MPCHCDKEEMNGPWGSGPNAHEADLSLLVGASGSYMFGARVEGLRFKGSGAPKASQHTHSASLSHAYIHKIMGYLRQRGSTLWPPAEFGLVHVNVPVRMSC